MMKGDLIIEIKDLKVYYETKRGSVRAVDGVNLNIKRGEIFGLAGESGCGKTTLATSILRSIDQPAGRIVNGSIVYYKKQSNNVEPINVMELSGKSLRNFRWKEISMIPQSAMNALNPVMKIKDQIADVILAHEKIKKEEAYSRVETLLKTVGIDPDRKDDYPHEFSGGMKQRSLIAMALALNPSMIIADEPTTALDVIVQRQILQTMKDLQKKFDLTMLFITHDMAVHAEISNRIGIMYAGKLVEVASATNIFYEPLHPYTKGLISAFPSIKGEIKRLESMPGHPPSLLNPPKGCRFYSRCPYAVKRCSQNDPALLQISKERWVACHKYL